MSLKTFNAKTPGLRHRTILKFENIEKTYFKGKASLKKYIKKNSGRNCFGHITVRRRGGGVKQLYRQIDFKRNDSELTVSNLEYDPNRTALIARCFNEAKQYCYIIAPQGVEKGDVIHSKSLVKGQYNPGDTALFKNLAVGSLIHNIELKQFKGAQLVRSAGNFAQIIEKNSQFARVRLRSGEQRNISLNCSATVGIVSNPDSNKRKLGKAGVSRWLGRRPQVRGVAMNPVDHPHGGGQGKTSGGRPSVTPYGKLTKGQPTRKKFKLSDKSIFLSVRRFKALKKKSSRKGRYSL